MLVPKGNDLVRKAFVLVLIAVKLLQMKTIFRIIYLLKLVSPN